MKILKLFILFLALGLTSACSNDDDGNTEIEQYLTNEEKIVGNWKLRGRTEHGIEFCELETSFTFESDNSLLFDFHVGDEPVECMNIEAHGTWGFEDENIIIINLVYNGTEELELLYEFEGNNTLKLSDFDENGEIGLTETYRRQ